MGVLTGKGPHSHEREVDIHLPLTCSRAKSSLVGWNGQHLLRPAAFPLSSPGRKPGLPMPPNTDEQRYLPPTRSNLSRLLPMPNISDDAAIIARARRYKVDGLGSQAYWSASGWALTSRELTGG